MIGDLDNLPSIVVNGVSLAYCERGRGEAVLLVHGGASDLRTWHNQLEPIGNRYRAIAYSRRYARPNADIDEGRDDTMDPHVEDLMSLLDALDVQKAHIVGHSWGALIGLLVAIRHPQVVRSLVLMEPPILSMFVSTPPRPTELLRLFCSNPRLAAAIVKFGAIAFAPAQKAFRRGDDMAAIRAFGTGVLGKDFFDNLSQARMQQVWENRNADKAQILGDGFPPLDKAEVGTVDIASLLLVGRHSPPFLRHMSTHLHKLMRHSELIEIANASHMMHEDNPRDVNATVLPFLARQSS
jgi:pimeloyl-ACP methyl ester carboxylesterase